MVRNNEHAITPLICIIVNLIKCGVILLQSVYRCRPDWSNTASFHSSYSQYQFNTLLINFIGTKYIQQASLFTTPQSRSILSLFSFHSGKWEPASVCSDCNIYVKFNSPLPYCTMHLNIANYFDRVINYQAAQIKTCIMILCEHSWFIDWAQYGWHMTGVGDSAHYPTGFSFMDLDRSGLSSTLH